MLIGRGVPLLRLRLARCKEISLARISPGCGESDQAINDTTKSLIAFTTRSTRFFLSCIFNITQLLIASQVAGTTIIYPIQETNILRLSTRVLKGFS